MSPELLIFIIIGLIIIVFLVFIFCSIKVAVKSDLRVLIKGDDVDEHEDRDSNNS